MTLPCASVLLASSFICSRRRREVSNDRRRSPGRKRRRRWAAGWWRSIQHHHDGSRGGEILNFMALKHCYGKWDESCVTFWRPPGALAFEASSVGMVIARHPIIRDQVFWSHRRGHCIAASMRPSPSRRARERWRLPPSDQIWEGSNGLISKIKI